MDDHILSIFFFKFAAVLPIFIFMSSSTLPSALITLPRYLNLSTISIVSPSILISSLVLSLTFCWMTSEFGFIVADFKSNFCSAFSKLVVIIYKSPIESAVNAKLSPKSRSPSLFSFFHLMSKVSNLV